MVALKPIADSFGDARTVPSLCYALAWLGSSVGGLAMGQIAERIGVRWTVMFGAVMIATGLALSSIGHRLDLYIGHGLFMGLLGNAGLNAPLYVYVSRWFDRRRGSALALIASGQAVAGTIWAPLFGQMLERIGWQRTMQVYAVFVVVVIVPVALLVFRRLAQCRDCTRRWPSRTSDWLAGTGAEAGHRPRSAEPCELFVLCADGDAARPSGRLLQ